MPRRSHVHEWLLVAGACLAASCGPSPFSPAEARTLAEAEARWASHGPSHYTIEMRRLCFCPDEVTQWATVEVRHDTVIAVTLPGGDPVPAAYWSLRPPVPDLFAQLHAPPPDWVRDVTATYDPVVGYPVAMRFESDDSVADADWTIEARNLVSLD
jgi:hypothetical protein